MNRKVTLVSADPSRIAPLRTVSRSTRLPVHQDGGTAQQVEQQVVRCLLREVITAHKNTDKNLRSTIDIYTSDKLILPTAELNETEWMQF